MYSIWIVLNTGHKSYGFELFIKYQFAFNNCNKESKNNQRQQVRQDLCSNLDFDNEQKDNTRRKKTGNYLLKKKLLFFSSSKSTIPPNCFCDVSDGTWIFLSLFEKLQINSSDWYYLFAFCLFFFCCTLVHCPCLLAINDI